MKKLILIGNPNCGKTTLFNMLTKSRQATGNRHGVTVKAAEGIYKAPDGARCTITDLPGTYSLAGFTAEEKEVSRYLENEEYDGIICVINSLNPERSIKLLCELEKYRKPVTCALNFGDELKKRGIIIDENMLKSEFCTDFIKCSAAKSQNLDTLMKAALECKSVPVIHKCENTLDFSAEICKKAFTKPEKKVKIKFKPDTVILNKYASIPVMLALTLMIFALTFSGAVGAVSDWLYALITEKLCGALQKTAFSSYFAPQLISLFCDGALKGVGSVISFLPQLTVLTFLTAVFEDSGLMSRCAYIFDKPLKKLGLQGKCFFCLITGFGCTVPAALSTRVLENRRDRIKTLLLLPFFPCSAKMPLILLLAPLFSQNAVRAVLCVYSLSIFTGIVFMLISQHIFKDKEKKLFILELPEYRLPGLASIKYAVFNRTAEFLFKAGTVIFISSIVMWFCTFFTPSFQYTANGVGSISAFAGEKALIFLRYAGITDPRQSAALISGIFAREAVVSSLEILYNGKQEILSSFTRASALSYCVFSLLFAPCVSSLITIKKELKNNKIFISALLFECVAAYAVSVAVFQIGRLFF